MCLRVGGLGGTLAAAQKQEEPQLPKELKGAKVYNLPQKGKEARVREIFSRWGLDAVEVGVVTDTGRAEIFFHGEKVVDMLFELADETRATMVLVTHDMALTGRCGRVARMEDGIIEDQA